MSRSFFRGLISAAVFASALVRVDAESVDTIIKRMNADAKKFNSVSADMHQVDYNAVLKDSTDSSAEVRIRRYKGGFAGILQYKPPEARTVGFSGHTVKVYYPNANTVNQISAGKELAHVSEFFLFGTSGEELQRTYSIASAGVENIGTTPTTHLVLTPKSPDLQKLITRLDVWIPNGRSYPVQEKATEPSGTVETFSFSNLQINPSLPASAFELKIPHGTKVTNQK